MGEFRGLDIHEIGHTKPLGHLDFTLVQVNTNDLVCPRKAQTLDNIESNTAKAEDHAS
jgi:hypothetical protein